MNDFLSTGIFYFNKFGYKLPTFIGIIIFLLFLFMPVIEPLTPLGMRVVGLFLCTIIWWVFVNVGYTSIMCIVLLVATGAMTPDEAFASSLGHWVVLFLIGCFGLTEGLKVTGFSKRFASWFLSRPFTSNRPWVLMILFYLACTAMGSVMSAAVTTVAFMTIAISIFKILGYEKGNKVASMIMIGIAWSATSAMAMTPIAHAGNIMMIEWIREDFNYTVTFINWMIIGIPIGFLFCIFLVGFFKFVIGPDVSRFSFETAEYARNELKKMGPISSAEKVALGVFFAVFIVWIIPDLTDKLFPQVSTYFYGLGYAVPALAGAALLCFITIDKKPIITFYQWFRDGIEWESMILVAAVMAVGTVMGSPETGIPQFLTKIFVSFSDGLPLYVFLLFVVMLLVLQTNIMSNIVSMTIIYNIMVPIAIDANIGDPVALGVTIAAASNYAFMLPPATASTALIIGSGWASPKQMAHYGAYLIVPVLIIFPFIFYPYAAFILR